MNLPRLGMPSFRPPSLEGKGPARGMTTGLAAVMRGDVAQLYMPKLLN